MLDEVISSLKTNTLQKAKNPFLGTFVIVWLIRNWKFVYSFFNMDAECTLSERINIIEGYLQNSEALLNLFYTICISIAVLLVTYALLSLSRLIINFYDQIVNPYLYKLTDKSSVVLKSDYLKLQAENSRLEKKIDDEHVLRLRIQNDYEQLERKYSDSIDSKSSISSKGKEVNLYSLAEQALNQIIEDKKMDDFLTVSQRVLNATMMDKRNDLSKYFTSLGIIKPGPYLPNMSEQSFYEFTELGRYIYDKEILLATKS